MKEISFKMRKNYELNRKFCAVKVETLFINSNLILGQLVSPIIITVLLQYPNEFLFA